MTKRFALLCVFLNCALLGCSAATDPHMTAKSSENKQQLDWQKRADKNVDLLVQREQLKLNSLSDYEHMRWVAKASLFLRGQKELSPETDDLQKLQSLSREQVVELFINSDEFYNTVGDFTLFYLGFRFDPLFENEKPNPRIYYFNQMLTAVTALVDNKSFLNLFEVSHPTYVKPFFAIDDSVFQDLGIPLQNTLSDLQKRHLIFESAIAKAKLTLQLTDDAILKEESTLCSYFSNFDTSVFFSDGIGVGKMGISSSTYSYLVQNFIKTPNQ